MNLSLKLELPGDPELLGVIRSAVQQLAVHITLLILRYLGAPSAKSSQTN